MDKREAQLILSSYTLGEPPTDDSRFAEARALAESDADLAAWWSEQKACDQLIQNRLRASSVPGDLKSALTESIADRRRTGYGGLVFRNWMAIAASLLVIGYLYFQYGIDRSDDYQGPLIERAYAYSVDGPRLSYFDKDTQRLQDWLQKNGIDLPDRLPPKLLQLEGIGCRPLKWSDDRVALMCFNAETVYHLFVAQKSDFPDFPASDTIEYTERPKGWAISKWTDGTNVFVLTARTTTERMADYLAEYRPVNAKAPRRATPSNLSPKPARANDSSSIVQLLAELAEEHKRDDADA